MTKKKVTSSRAAAEALARQQHMAVREFLNQEPTRTQLLTGLVEKKGEGNELALLEVLLERKRPISGKNMQLYHGMPEATVSEAAKEINEHLINKFSKTIEPLKAKRVVICIPRRKGRGGLFVGYHFACYHTKTKKYLDGPATKKLFKGLWENFIEDRLRNTLEEDARSSLSERLKGRDDYQFLNIEIGFIKKKLQQPRIDESLRVQQPKAYDHNRVWKSFNIDSLLQSGGTYVISVDAGRGKTTFLRYLQTEFLRKRGLIPIFLDASEIEQWKLEDTRGLAEKLAKKIKLKVQEDKVTDFLTQAIGKDIILLIDGLDQIRIGGNEYVKLANHILDDLAKSNVIITSRPSAVINLEDEQKFTFLRLEPFNANAQDKYFGEHYKRARELSTNAPDLVAIPMLAYMVRMLIEEKRDKHIKTHTELYEEFIDYILTKYKHGKSRLDPDVRTQIRQSLRRISYDALAEKEPHIQKIPLKFCYNKGRVPDEPTGRKGEFLTKSGLANLILERSGGGDKDFLFFTHPSFQEYLAAERAAQSEKRIDHILNEMWNPKWKEVIKFLAGLIGENFVRRIYSPGCKDNCIHSRLFLAAECCKELGGEMQVERHLLSELAKLVYVPPFEKDAVAAISYLNIPEAVDFLVELIPKWTRYIVWPKGFVAGPIQSILIDSLEDIARRFQPEHIDKIIDYLGTEDAEWASLVADKLLDMIVDHLSPSLTTKLLNLLCYNKDLQDDVRVADLLDEPLSYEHIDYVVELSQSQNSELREGALELLHDLLRSYEISDEYIQKSIDFCASEDHDVREHYATVLVNLPTKLSSENVGRLFRHLEDCEGGPLSDILWVLGHSVSAKDISWGRADKIILRLTDPDDQVKERVATAISNWYGQSNDILSLRQVACITSFLKGQDTNTRRNILFLLGEICDERHYKFISKAIALMHERNPELQSAAMRMCQRITHRGYGHMVAELLDHNKVTELSKHCDSTLSNTAISTLRLLFDYLDRSNVPKPIDAKRNTQTAPLPSQLSSSQVQQVLTRLKSTDEYDQITDEALMNAIELFKTGNKSVQRRIVLLFLHEHVSLNNKHLDKLMDYLSDEKNQFDAGQLFHLFSVIERTHLHCKSGNCRRYIDKALEYIQTKEVEKWNRSVFLLNYASNFFTDEDIRKIVVAYVENLPKQLECLDIHPILIPKKLLPTQIKLLLDFLADKDAMIRQRALDFLFWVRNRLEPGDIQVIAKLLDDPEHSIRESAYYLFKNTIALYNNS